MIDVLIIYPDGTAVVKTISGQYPSINEAMGVQMIQGIYTPGLAYYLDEEGKFPPGQPANPFAEYVYRHNGGQLLPGDFLVGPVAIVGMGDFPDPEERSTPQWVIDLVKDMGLELLTKEE